MPRDHLPDSLQYRFALPDEVPDVARLVAHSFPGAPRTPAWWNEQLTDPVYGGGHDTLFIGRDRERAVAACQLHPLQQWIAGESIPIAGVGSVAISPTHRKRRLGAELVAAGLRAARERGAVASALYPFRSSFYQKLGYGQADFAHQYQVAPDSLPDSFERASVELVDTDAGYAEVLTYYSRWARTQTGQLERSPRVWASLTQIPDRALVAYRNTSGKVDGYALAVYRTDLPRRDRFLEVDEIVWSSVEARRGLYGWLSSLGDQWTQILMRGLPSQHIADWIREPRLPPASAPNWGLWAPAGTLMMGTMFRLLNLPAAWDGRPVVTPATPFSVGFEVTDMAVSENSGFWRVSFEGTRAVVDRKTRVDVSIRLDVSTLSRLFIGSLAPASGLDAGLLHCDRPDALRALQLTLALPEPWTFDRF